MAEDHDFRFLEDARVIRQMLGLKEEDQIPDSIPQEYDYRISMMHRCGVTGRLRPAEIMEMLRFLKLHPKREDRKVFSDTPTDWRDVVSGTRVIVTMDDPRFMPTAKNRTAPKVTVKGTFKGIRGNATVVVDIPTMDPRLQTFYPKDVKIDNGKHEELPKIDMTNDDWAEVDLGTRIISVGDDGKQVAGMLAVVGPGQDRLTLILENSSTGEMIVVDRAKSMVSDEVLAAI